MVTPGLNYFNKSTFDLLYFRHHSFHGYKNSIKLKNTKQSGKSRMGTEKFDEVKVWTDTVGEYIKTYNFTTPLVLNVDETRSEPKEHTQLRLCSSEGEGRVTYVRNSDLRTSFHVIAADGKVWLTIYIYTDDATADPDRAGSVPVYYDKKPLRSDWPILYAKTPRGFMTQELFGEALKKVVELADEFRRDLPMLIFADRPQCHNSTDLVVSLYNLDAHLVWFPANTSQVLQPLDGTPYATLKKLLKETRDDELLKRTLTGEKQTQVIAEISPFVEREAFTTDVVMSGFKDRGVWPFDKALILERARAEFLKPQAGSAVVEEAERALRVLIGENQRPSKVQKVRVSGIPKLNTLYTPVQLIAADKEKKEREMKEAEEKEAAKKAKVDEKKRKQEEKEAQRKELEEKREAKKRAAEETKAARLRELEAKKAARLKNNSALSYCRKSQQKTDFITDDEDFVGESDANDENDYPVNLPNNIVTTKRKREKIDYGKFASNGNKRVKGSDADVE
jgi:hypothetical protein